MILTCIPYRTDKNLGKAYNEAFSLIGDDDWLCVHDCDTLFLLPETITHLHGYAERYPGALLTCYANRNHQMFMKMQLLGGVVSENTDIKYHIELAQKQTEYLYEATPIKNTISGFLMLMSKRMWNENKFPENMRCIGVDTRYSHSLLRKKVQILRMDGVYVWHTYRLINGVLNKKHLL